MVPEKKGDEKARSDYVGKSGREAEVELNVAYMEKKKNIRYRLLILSSFDLQTYLFI